MKSLLTFLLITTFILTGCKSEKKENSEENSDNQSATYITFGNKIDVENAISKEMMQAKFADLKSGDTLNVKFKTSIDEVCQSKGCWIKVPLADDNQSFVKFKDYAFFLPMNSQGSEVILNGKAFKTEVSVKELQHYAQDAGKTDEEIAKITEPKVTYGFIADGVLLENPSDE